MEGLHPTSDDMDYGFADDHDDILVGEPLRDFAAVEGLDYTRMKQAMTCLTSGDDHSGLPLQTPPRKRPVHDLNTPASNEDLFYLQYSVRFLVSQIKSMKRRLEEVDSSRSSFGKQLQEILQSLSSIKKSVTDLQQQASAAASKPASPQISTGPTPPIRPSGPPQPSASHAVRGTTTPDLPSMSERTPPPHSPPPPPPPPPPPASSPSQSAQTPSPRTVPANATTAKATPKSNSSASASHPTIFEEPFNRMVRAIGVPYSDDHTEFQSTLQEVESLIQKAADFRDPVVKNVQPSGKPYDSKKFPGTRIINVVIEFKTVWAQRSALRRQRSLKQRSITLVEELPNSYRAERAHRLQLLKQLPRPSLPARVFGVDFYYLPSNDCQPQTTQRYRRGRWVWAPSFEHLKSAVDLSSNTSATASAPSPSASPVEPSPRVQRFASSGPPPSQGAATAQPRPSSTRPQHNQPVGPSTGAQVQRQASVATTPPQRGTGRPNTSSSFMDSF